MSEGATRSMKSSWPGAQVGEAHGGVDDRLVDDALEMDLSLVPVGREALEHDAVLRDPLDELNGPEHTGLAPNLSPAASAALGETIMPARSVSTASSGANGAARLMRTVCGSTASTLDTTASSPRRFEPFMFLWRSRLYLTAAASIFSPSWKVTPWRSLTSSDLLSADHL